MCVSISRVSDLCVIILRSRKRAGMPTWCPLDEGCSWHLSVSGRPSVAPSISLADSRGPEASLTPLLHRLYATLPAPAEGHSAARTSTWMQTHTHTSVPRATLQERSDLEGNVSPRQTMTPAPFCHSVLLFVFLSSPCLVLPLFLPGHLFPPSFLLSTPPASPSCPLKSMVNSCISWLCARQPVASHYLQLGWASRLNRAHIHLRSSACPNSAKDPTVPL